MSAGEAETVDPAGAAEPGSGPAGSTTVAVAPAPARVGARGGQPDRGRILPLVALLPDSVDADTRWSD
ncbi:hypothetical protein [Streptomyces atroolivaceus]|uniref:hypothetical protein n=1 Tax=Streptomyces atroolivaceus TaxID=66869 RepID=UPI00363FD299